jgi:hypothetical protein
MTVVVRAVPAALLAALVLAGPLSAQESKSAALARQLASALEGAKLTSVAARDPATEDVFIGALYLPGLQLIAISARYAAPALLAPRLVKREYRDIYIELNSATERGSRVVVSDLGLNGLVARPEGDEPADSYDAAGRSIRFNRDWRGQGLSEEEYLKAFAEADERYARMLSALLAELKGAS